MPARAAVPLLLFASPLAAAQPLGPKIQNLRVDLRCADAWATPGRGLSVTVDGLPAPPVEVNGTEAIGYTEYGPESEWEPTDVGFALVAGVHRVAFAAPGCAPVALDLDVQPIVPIFVSGRLPVADPALRGPAGAPDGFGLALGAYSLSRGPHTGDDSLFATHYAYDASSSAGFWMSTGYEHRGFVFALDLLFGGGSVSGTATATGDTGGSNPGPFPLDGDTFELGSTLRLGARLPFDHVTLSAGTGLGGDLWLGAGTVHEPDLAGDAFVANPGLDASWYVPVWAAIAYKPSCNWGVQLLASYDVYPGDAAQDAPALAAGLMWQPSHACSEPAGLSVR